MALTQTQVSMLYVAIFNRASEGNGNTYWQDKGTMIEVANAMLDTTDAQEYFGSSLDSNQAFIEWIYQNTLNKTLADDPDGIQYWVTQLESGASRGEVVAGLVEAVEQYAESTDAETKAAYDQFMNRVAVSDYTANILAEAPLDYKQSLGFGDELPVTNDPATVSAAEGNVAGLASAVVLTEDTDIVEGGTFVAPMVYTPDGSDRILSLQDEDILTGLGDSATLDITMGNRNGDEATTATVTPTLNNIKTINVDWTGNTNTLDLRNADSVENLNIDKITADGAAVAFNNISSEVGDMDIANVRDNASTVAYDYVRGILSAEDDVASISLNNVLMNNFAITTQGGTAEGFETVAIEALNGVDLQGGINIAQMDYLTISGSDYLDMVRLTPIAPVSEFEYDALGAAAIANPGSAGLRSIDASEFTGEMTLDISSALGRQVDPSNSGAPFYGETTGGQGDDTLYTSIAVAGDDDNDNGHNIIDGGTGENTLVTTVGTVANDAEISNVQTLEIRDQAGLGTTDMDAFDDSLTSIFMRGERAAASTFDLDDVTATQAENALTLAHSISGALAQTVDVELADATGATDTVALNVVNDLNTGNTFNYTLNAYGKDSDTKANGTTGDVDVVENVTINDNDTESNTLTLGNINDHTGTVTLTGGVAGDTFTVAGSLIADTVDASSQASDLRLTVGDTTAPIDTITQDIKLGTGDDILIFGNIDDLDATDSVTDAGGTDVVKAAFSEDSDLALADIEGIHLIANDNVTLGMANTDTDALVLLADNAADGDADASPTTAEPFNIAGVAVTDVITMTDTSLATLTFSADLDNDDDVQNAALVAAAQAAAAAAGGVGTAAGDAAYQAIVSDESTVANFNGVTLANNTGDTLTVEVNADLDDVVYGATAYNIGQLTAHGVTTMSIEVSDEDTTFGAANAVTTINNVYAKNLETLTVTAEDDVALGTVSGAALNNSLKTFDASNVGGDVTARVISLGDNATVTLADGDHNFSALGSAGKDVTITSGNGESTITGTAQDDTITTGSANDDVHGDRGDNVISVGAGNDFVTAKDGNDTVDFGTGFGYYLDNVGAGSATGQDGTQATNTVALQNGIVATYIDVTGDDTYNTATGVVTTAAGTVNVNQMLAVGNGSDLTIKWTGATLDINSAVLDGTTATVAAPAGTTTGDANSNLAIQTAAGLHTFNGAAGNDVYIADSGVAGIAVTFNGGAGNDAVVAGDGTDVITGGLGADNIVVQNTSGAFDGNIDTVVIADGESTVAGFDTIVRFDTTAASAIGTAANAAGVAGGDLLDLTSNTIAAVAAAGGTAVGDVATYSVAANGLVTFQDAAGANQMVGTRANDFTLDEALAFLSANVAVGDTVLFQYDMNGDGAINHRDSAFVFQGGASDTVVQIVNDPLNAAVVINGLEAVGTGTAGLVEIA